MVSVNPDIPIPLPASAILEKGSPRREIYSDTTWTTEEVLLSVIFVSSHAAQRSTGLKCRLCDENELEVRKATFKSTYFRSPIILAINTQQSSR